MYSLVFLKGVHKLSYDFTLSGHDVTSNISTLVFQGQGSLPGDTVIYLLPLTSISLSNVAQIHLFNISVEGHVAERSGNSCVVFQHIYLIDLNQLKTSNVTIRSDASTHQISIRECNFRNSTFQSIKEGNIYIGNVENSVFIRDTSFSGGEKGVDVQSAHTLSILNCNFQNIKQNDIYIGNVEKFTRIKDTSFSGGKRGV